MAISSALGSSALLPAGLGFRNFVINGDMRIAQRNTSQASIASGNYWTVDRYRINYSGTAGTWTQTQSTDGPAGFGNSLKMECTTATTPLGASAELAIVQRFEGQNLQSIAKGTVSAKPLMVSFWVKSNKTGTYICELYDYNNSRNCSKSYSITTAGVWQYVTISFPPDTTGAFTNNANLSLHICWFLATGSNFTTGSLQTEWGTAVTANRAVGQTNLADTVGNYWQVTGVQLEQNLQPTPFEQRPIGLELALCQRYYWRQNSEVTGVSQRIGGTGSIYGGNTFVGVFNMPVTMRTRPTGSLEYSGLMCTDDISFDSTGGTWSISTNYGSPRSVLIYGGPLTGTVSMQYVKLGIQSGANNYMAISAEL